MQSGVVRRALVNGACRGAMAMALFAATAVPAHAVEITAVETVALTSDTAPGTGVPYSLFSRAWLNDAGEVLFYATLSGGATGLFWWPGSGDENAVAITGAAAPGFATAPLETIASGFTWAGARGPAFFASLADGAGVTSDDDDLVYGSDPSGSLAIVARQGDVAPDTGGQTFGTSLLELNYAAASDFGLVFANRTRLAGGGFGDRGLWRQSGAGTTALALEGDPAPGVAGGDLVDFRGSVINDSGVTLTWARVDTVGRALYSFGDGAPVLVALEGEAAPGTGAAFQSLTENTGELGINDAGEFAFRSGLDDGTTAAFAPDGVGGTRVLIRSGDPAPGAPGAVFSSPDDLALAADGSIVLEGYLETGVGGVTNADDFGLWGTAGAGPLHLIAREGDRPAGLPAAARFAALQRWEVNGSGEVVLSGTYFPPASGTAEDGLWHHDLYTGVTSLLLRRGDAVEVAPGDLRSVTSVGAGIRAAGGGDGKGRAWNDAGQLAASISFEGGSRGVFRLTVPEPATGAGAAALAALIWLRASRRDRRLS